MTERDDRWLREGKGEPEPDWAEQIRAGRKARGDRLRDVFATFDQDDPSVPVSTKPRAEPELYDHEQEPPA